VAYLIIALGFALAGGIVGKLKGSSFFIWFLISGVLPFVGLIAALLYRWDRDEPRRQCPRCGRIVKLHDAICTNCGQELEYPDVVLAPESATPRPRAS
jgi:hypothetical protein